MDRLGPFWAPEHNLRILMRTGPKKERKSKLISLSLFLHDWYSKTVWQRIWWLNRCWSVGDNNGWRLNCRPQISSGQVFPGTCISTQILFATKFVEVEKTSNVNIFRCQDFGQILKGRRENVFLSGDHLGAQPGCRSCSRFSYQGSTSMITTIKRKLKMRKQDKQEQTNLHGAFFDRYPI